MRIRATKPEFWRSKTIAELPWDVRLVLKGLESYVDDNGVGKDDIALIAADVFPRDLAANPRDTLARLSEAISTLSGGGLIVRYEVAGENLVYIDRWKQQQRIDKPAKGRFRRPDGTLEYVEDVDRASYASPRETVASPPEVLAPVTGEQGNRGTGDSATRGASAPRADAQTLVAEWIDHCAQRPPGNVIGQVSKQIKTMLGEDIAPDRIRAALVEWNTKGLHPSTLPSVVHEQANRKPRTGSSRNDDFRAMQERQMARAIEAERKMGLR